jgi:predicted membrane-bound dolichyl-phosphate-mannose-protein mannosyltransferase
MKIGGPFSLLNSKWHWHNHVKTHKLVCVDIQIPQLLKKEELINWVLIMIALFFSLNYIEGNKSLSCED